MNVPKEATVDEITQAYVESWRLGAKAISIYRDGSKHSQVLSTTTKKKQEPGAQATGKQAQTSAEPKPVAVIPARGLHRVVGAARDRVAVLGADQHRPGRGEAHDRRRGEPAKGVGHDDRAAVHLRRQEHGGRCPPQHQEQGHPVRSGGHQAPAAARDRPEVLGAADETAAVVDPSDRSLQVLFLRGLAQRKREWNVAHERREQIRARWAELFTQVDVLLCPIAGTAETTVTRLIPNPSDATSR